MSEEDGQSRSSESPPISHGSGTSEDADLQSTHELNLPSLGESVSLSSTLLRMANQSDGTSTLQSIRVAQVVPTPRPTSVPPAQRISFGNDNTENGSNSSDESETETGANSIGEGTDHRDGSHFTSHSRNYLSFRLNTLQTRQKQARVIPNDYTRFWLQHSKCNVCVCVCVCACMCVCVYTCKCVNYLHFLLFLQIR